MDINELENRLAEEGCNPLLYAIGAPGTASDAFSLTQVDGTWQVCYTERGLDDDPIFTSKSEDEACQFFFRHIMGMRHDHCVGFFRSEQVAQELGAKLKQHGVESHQDKIPFGGWTDPRFRVFVTGKAIFKARELLGVVPIED